MGIRVSQRRRETSKNFLGSNVYVKRRRVETYNLICPYSVMETQWISNPLDEGSSPFEGVKCGYNSTGRVLPLHNQLVVKNNGKYEEDWQFN